MSSTAVFVWAVVLLLLGYALLRWMERPYRQRRRRQHQAAADVNNNNSNALAVDDCGSNA